MAQADVSGRVLVFAPVGRDGAASVQLFRRSSITAENVDSVESLTQQVARGAGAVFVAEEGLFGSAGERLFDWVAQQPAWSDLPFIILTSHQERPAITVWRRRLVTSLRNVMLLERPLHGITLISATQAALRARAKQHEVRALLVAQEHAAEQLEAQISSRTAELADANGALRAQMEERAKVEESLRQAQKIEAIGQLTGGIAHDFNNLLMVISGGLEMLDRQTDPARRKRLMEGMQHAARRGAGLTRQLLAFSRRQQLKPEPIDLARQIGGMRELLDRSLRGDVYVDFEFAEDLWPVEADPGELELVVLNLAVNARDAMPDGGTIVVRAQNSLEAAGAEFVRLTFTDTGTGMTPEVQARVFEPFYTTKEVGKGSGLGLAQVYGFAQQSGGSIRIDSEVGRGTTIELLLPRSQEAPSADEHHLMELHVEPRRRSLAGSVLLVEDDDEVAALVGEMLEQLGFAVTRVASAAAALGALADGRPVDIVFSDIMMPGGMNGVELAREVHLRRAGLPVLLTSGYAGSARAEAEAEGMRILAKPYAINQLAAALEQARHSPAR
jgi:signal transduction histidine kinase/ActR/RegA family two-component response regulator